MQKELSLFILTGGDAPGNPEGLDRPANTAAERESRVSGDPLDRLWKDGIVSFCGVPSCFRKMFCVAIDSTPEEREEWLREVRRMTLRTFPPGGSP